MRPADRVWVSLGGNLGSVRSAFEAARLGIEALCSGALVASPVVESTPWGGVPQPPFLNQVVGGVPRVGPEEFLARLQEMERAHGRIREVRWGPRTLDLDVLCWPGRVQDDPALTLPHPRLHRRRFVLEPWATVAPELVVPGLGRTVAVLLAACGDGGSVRASGS